MKGKKQVKHNRTENEIRNGIEKANNKKAKLKGQVLNYMNMNCTVWLYITHELYLYLKLPPREI